MRPILVAIDSADGVRNLDRLASGLFKGVFGIVILLGALLVAASWAATGGMSWGILIPLALIGWIVLKPRKKAVDKDIPPATTIRPAKIGDRLEGVGAEIEVRAAGLAITRKGTSSFLIHGMKGEKLLPFKSLTAVQLKEPTRSMSGYIQFSLLGGIESSRGIWDASKDENTVLFTLDQLPAFLGLRSLVEDRLTSADTAHAAPSQSRAQELATLAALRSDGHLTDDEFATEKAKLLAS